MALGSTSFTAVTREALRNQMVTSMMGRRAGMDVAGYEVGEQDTRLPIDNITTTAPTSLAPNGFSVLSCTAASSAIQTMLQAVGGIYKQITQFSSSTLGIAVQLGANANIVTSAGSSFNQIVFAGVGHCVSLACVSSSTANGPIWMSASPASPGVTYSTY
jgi:hypothetical protein